MSDIGAVREMFTRAGVVWEEKQDEVMLDLLVHAKAGERNFGYNGFVAVLSFREDGSLHSVGAWE